MELNMLLFFVIFGISIKKSMSQNTFSAVTNFQGLRQLYIKMRSKETHIVMDTTTDIETRKSICQSVTTSAHFDIHYEEDPVDMDAFYIQIRDQAKRETESSHGGVFFQRVLQAYERDELSGNMFYTYRSTSITVQGIGNESAFACVTKIRRNGILMMYYISDQYNINAASDSVTNNLQIGVRFVIFAMFRKCRLVAMAEEPAIALACPEYSVESIYLRLRKSYFVAQILSEDPLCRLSRSEKFRVCASVLHSSHFIGRVKFFPDEKKMEVKCEFNTVSFRTEGANTEANGYIYREWMLSCPVEQTAGGDSLTYFVSQAYHSHHVFVYSRHLFASKWVWYIENISAKISVVGKGTVLTKDSGEHPPPNLVDLLNIA